MPSKTYFMVLPVRHFRLGPHQVALESAFTGHLILLQQEAAAMGLRLTLLMPLMDAATYNASAGSLATLDEQTSGIKIHAAPASLPASARLLWSITAEAAVVHSGLSWNMRNPFEMLSLLFGFLRRRVTLFVVDIDFRQASAMPSANAAPRSRLFDAFLTLQLRLAVSLYSIVLLKGQRFAADYATGHPNVHAFLDAAHHASYLTASADLEAKLARLSAPAEPLRLTYFGRFVPYKGIDAMIRSTAAAHAAGANVTLTLFGSGPQLPELQALTAGLHAESFITFHPPVPYGEALFAAIRSQHILLALPLAPDTPRSALDAMAAGLPFLAFDTDYYRELSASNAGILVPWPSEQAVTAAILQLHAHRESIPTLARAALDFAARNTQEIWVARRNAWTREALQKLGLL